ncbi:MAG TPA: GAF domain-containing SpoIIE family protein phosphatase [Clostridia bacterium]|nr:GAF domain-containing SpoIIE family protein phosphatase [Clostridia bacterium]
MSTKSRSDTGALEERLRQMMLLQHAAHKINSILDLDILLDAIVGDVADMFGCSRSAILLKDEATDELELVAVRGWTSAVHPKGYRFKIGREGLVGQAAAGVKPLYTPNVHESPRYIVSEETTKSELDIPLRIRGRVLGVFNVQHPEIDAFPEAQRNLLEALAEHLAIAIENARLFRQERLAKERLEKESAEARRVQASLLPPECQKIGSYFVSGRCLPMTAVGGDWFDYFSVGDGRLAIALGDVVGKGMPAALLMASTRSMLRQQAKSGISPANVLTKLNDILREDFPPGTFVTMVYGILDTREGALTLSNAGHPWPLVATPNNAEFLQIPGGLPLGIQCASFGESVVDLTGGSSVLLCSDGVLEATNLEGEEFGMERLRHSFAAKVTPHELLTTAQAFASPKILTDDATVLMIEHTGE